VLSNRMFTLVDAADYDRVSAAGPWLAHKLASRGAARYYAAKRPVVRGVRKPLVWLHRYIVKARSAQDIDHKNGNPLDNRRKNLRPSGNCGNSQNRGKHGGKRPYSSKYKGVSHPPGAKNWRAMITIRGKTHYKGSHATEVEAARAYDAAARKHFGRFACVNFPRKGERGALAATPLHPAIRAS
jgi:hypothetical protein